jgi:hypothetical protein
MRRCEIAHAKIDQRFNLAQGRRGGLPGRLQPCY